MGRDTPFDNGFYATPSGESILVFVLSKTKLLECHEGTLAVIPCELLEEVTETLNHFKLVINM